MNLDDLEALEKAATPGPWRYGLVGENGCAFVGTACDRPLPLIGYNFEVRQTAPNEDAAFIAAVRNAFPKLLALARAAKEVLTELDPDHTTGTGTVPGEVLARLESALAALD